MSLLSCKSTVKNLIAQTVLIGTENCLLSSLALTRFPSPTATAKTKKIVFKTVSSPAKSACQSVAFHMHHFYFCIKSSKCRHLRNINLASARLKKKTFDAKSHSH